ncbi:hypothetical protein AZI86_00560 [Bdellovibrio bacteriovorus]|uniref:Secreted protein n=1 Tax=Bdellovibrio bacteriovorus TaxID=959 RepID=A0A150WN27_BDEBC|nr:hypothetical protein [Bdellovibrio bacteriovorus]KYG65605.1 hypothetical protein AZI86_00560 [Bdellovibrio bacteriovorus]
MIAKILLPILLVMFIIPSTFAQTVGGGGSGGGGLRQRAAYAAPRRCVEGQRASFTERDNINDQSVTIVRTCQNGSYYDLSDYVYNPKSRCAEGRKELWQERDNANDRNVYRRVICTNGKWKVYDEYY